jgi:hypothetical protein
VGVNSSKNTRGRKKMMKREFILIIIIISSLCAALSKNTYAEETVSLYGYLANYFQGSFIFEDNKMRTPTWGDILLLRLKGDWTPEENLHFHTEVSFTGELGNQNPNVLYNSVDLGFPPQDQFPYNDFINELTIDHAWGLVNLGSIDLQFGKIPIAWGTGYIFNPTTKTVTTSYIDRVSEETPGTFGIVSSYYMGEKSTIIAYLAFQDRSHKNFTTKDDERGNNLPFGMKTQIITNSFDISFGLIKEVLHTQDGYQRNYYLSTDCDGGIGDLGLYAETAVRLPVSRTSSSGKEYSFEENLEIAVGGYYTVYGIDTDVRLEYYHQGKGKSRKSKYDIMKILTQEKLVLGEDYLFVSLERPFLYYWKSSCGSLFNLNDGSFVLFPEVAYDVYNNFQISAGSFIFAGKTETEFNGEFRINGTDEIDITETFSLFMRGKICF